MELTSEVKIIFDIFSKSSYSVFLIGGAVRDYIISRNVSECDFTTNATPEVVVSLFKDYETSIYRKDLGLTIVKINGQSFEITTMRKEIGVKDLRYPKKIVLIDNLKQDTLRRDFTINQIAYNPSMGYLDYHNGIKDLHDKTIRFIGEAKKRIKEDPLRILRAIRLAGKLGFTIDPNDYKWIIKKAKLASRLNDVRYKELFKICELSNAIEVLSLYQEVLIPCFPELKDHYQDILQSNVSGDHLIVLIMYVSKYLDLYDTLKKYKKMLEQIKESNILEVIEQIKQLS